MLKYQWSCSKIVNILGRDVLMRCLEFSNPAITCIKISQSTLYLSKLLFEPSTFQNSFLLSTKGQNKSLLRTYTKSIISQALSTVSSKSTSSPPPHHSSSADQILMAILSMSAHVQVHAFTLESNILLFYTSSLLRTSLLVACQVILRDKFNSWAAYQY